MHNYNRIIQSEKTFRKELSLGSYRSVKYRIQRTRKKDKMVRNNAELKICVDYKSVKVSADTSIKLPFCIGWNFQDYAKHDKRVCVLI